MQSSKKSERIESKYREILDVFESQWKQWSAEDIVIWFQYRTTGMNLIKVRWDHIQNVMKSRNIRGKMLRKLNDLTFELIGMNDTEIAEYLQIEIDRLTGEHRVLHPKERNQRTQPSSIPKKYLCPLSKVIMKDPVMAFDGYCYERSAIETYFEVHHKSPITGAEVECLNVFPNHRLKADCLRFLNESEFE